MTIDAPPTTSPPRKPPPPTRTADVPLQGGVDLHRFFLTHVTSTVFLLTAGLLFYGWRAAVAIGLVVGSAIVGMLVWRRIGRRGAELRLSYGIWMAMLLAMALPAHLATLNDPGPGGAVPWPVLVAAGLMLPMFLWLFGAGGSSRLHPVPVVYLLLVVLFQGLLVPGFVLHSSKLVVGDVLDTATSVPLPPAKEPWANAPPQDADALRVQRAAEVLGAFTSGTAVANRGYLSLDELIRDRVPPLEDLIIGAQPGPIGAGSAVAVIMGGLFLLYRGLIDIRLPMLIVIAAFVALLVLPIPVVITEDTPRWSWLAVRQPSVGLSWAVTLVNYELMAGPLLFVAFFLATAPGVRPMTRRARVPYAIVVGAAAAALQLYLSVSYGAYLALLLASPLTPLLDRWFKPRPLV
jgi:Na+-translocating ferredoxin:NAD+ oxidoreductase RnfD subunit